jgi:lipopolysaccharide transport system ATP-binding protein
MESVAEEEGRTILFVSHQMNAVKKLCTISMLLCDGQISTTGDPNMIVSKYVSSSQGENNSFSDDRADRFRRKGDTHKYFRNLWLDKSELQTNEPLTLKIIINASGIQRGAQIPFVEITFKNDNSDSIISFVSRWDNFVDCFGGMINLNVLIKSLPLSPGGYTIYLLFSDGQETLECIPSACRVYVSDGISPSGIILQPRTGCQVVGAATWSIG